MTDEHISRLLACLPDSNLPADIRGWLAELFSQQPDVLVDLDGRDDLLRMCIALSPGDSCTAKCSYFLDCIDGKHHTSATAQSLIDKLRISGVYVPLSVRHLKRVLKHRRQEGWRTELCPPVSVMQTVENPEEHCNERRKRNRR